MTNSDSTSRPAASAGHAGDAASAASGLARRAADLAQTGTNTLQGLVGSPDEARQRLRSTYLSWASDVERLLVEAGPGESTLADRLHSARHRSLVAAEVPEDQLWREVEAERDVRLRLLAHLAAAEASQSSNVPVGEVLVTGSGATYRWDPQAPLGDGGYGQVFAATDDAGTPLAVKRVPLRTTSTARWYSDARQAEREPAIAARLSPAPDAHILPLLDQHLEDNVLSLVMPRADYSLADLLEAQGPLDAAAVRRLVLDAAAGLRHLADKGVLHRDVTPGNLLWWNGCWVLSDFGVARDLAERTSTYTWAHTGTHDYWAPELFRLEQATARSDLYALGCVALEALTGAKPFTGDLAAAHRDDVPQVPDVGDPGLERAIAAMLHKLAPARPADARAVQQMLRPVAGLSATQQALQRVAATATRREQEREARVSAATIRDRQREDAVQEFTTLWEATTRLAQDVVPDAHADQLDTMTWALTVPGSSRLKVQLAEPSGRSSALLFGAVFVERIDDPPAALVANVRCRHDGTSSRWDLLTFTHNAISAARPPLGPTRQPNGRVGMSLSALDDLVEQLDAPGPPVVITEAVEMTPETLLAALTAELDEPTA